jgi:hypothetical protein
MIVDDFKTPVETFYGTSLHLDSYLVSATPEFLGWGKPAPTGCYLPSLLGIPAQPPGIVFRLFSPHQAQQ